MVKKAFRRLQRIWLRFLMHFAGPSPLGKMAAQMATWSSPPYKARIFLSKLNSKGYIAPSAAIYHEILSLGNNVFIGDRVTIYQDKLGGAVKLGRGVHLHSDIIIETGDGGQLIIGEDTHIQPRCQLSAHKGSIRIGSGVEIAPNCAFYPYDHAVIPGKPIRMQPLETKGDIVIEDEVWLGVGAIVLNGVRIGRGAVIGAGSVVTSDIPENAIAAGVPARVIKMRDEVVATVRE
jgi:acetyltransferase-like isoleucine patch superfamily enzyme